jgi:hypothetical protein
MKGSSISKNTTVVDMSLLNFMVTWFISLTYIEVPCCDGNGNKTGLH